MNVIDLTDDVNEQREVMPIGADISADVINVEDEFGDEEEDDSNVIVLDDDEDDNRKKDPFLLVHYPTLQLQNYVPSEPPPMLENLQANHHRATNNGSQTIDEGHGTTQRRRIVSTGTDPMMPNHVIDLSSADVEEQHEQPNVSESSLSWKESQRKSDAPHIRNTPTTGSGTDLPPPGYQTKGRRRRRPESISEGATLPKGPTVQYRNMLLDDDHNVHGDQANAARVVSHSDDTDGDHSAFPPTPLTEQSHGVRSRQSWNQRDDNVADQISSDVQKHGKPHSCSGIPFHDDQPTSRYKRSRTELEYQHRLHEENEATRYMNVPSNQGPTGTRRDPGDSSYRDEPAGLWYHNIKTPHPRGGFTRNHQHMPQLGYNTNHGNRHCYQGPRSHFQEPRHWEADQARAAGGRQYHRSFAEQNQRHGVHQNHYQQNRMHHHQSQHRRSKEWNNDNGQRHQMPRRTWNVCVDTQAGEGGARHHHPLMEHDQVLSRHPQWRAPPEETERTDGNYVSGIQVNDTQQPQHSDTREMLGDHETATSHHNPLMETLHIEGIYQLNMQEEMAAHSIDSCAPEKMDEVSHSDILVPSADYDPHRQDRPLAEQHQLMQSECNMPSARSESSLEYVLQSTANTGEERSEIFYSPFTLDAVATTAPQPTPVPATPVLTTNVPTTSILVAPVATAPAPTPSGTSSSAPVADTPAPAAGGTPAPARVASPVAAPEMAPLAAPVAPMASPVAAPDDFLCGQDSHGIIDNGETQGNHSNPGPQSRMSEPGANVEHEETGPKPQPAWCKQDARLQNFVDLSSDELDGEVPNLDATTNREQPYATTSGTGMPTVKKTFFRANKTVKAFKLAGRTSQNPTPMAKSGSSKGRTRKAPQAKQPASHPKQRGEESGSSCFRWTFYDQSASKQNKNIAGKRQRSSEPCKVSKRIPDEATDRFFKRSRDYNFSISEQDALELQEKLFREAAARVRAQKTTYVEVGAERQFMEPIQDIARIYPNHWTWSNPYARLGLPPGAPLSLIKLHYRKLALKYHPDKCHLADAAHRFQAVTGAYQSLTRPGT